MQCPLHNQKVNKPSFHGASYQLAPFNSQTIWNHKYSTYQQHCSGSKCSLWGMKMTTLPKLVEFSFILYMSASVIECRSIGNCNSSGLCAGLMITGFHFQLLLTLLPSIFKNLCYNTDLVCFAKTVSPAPVFVQIPGSHHPGTRLRLASGFRDPGSILRLGQVTQYGNPYLICILRASNNERVVLHTITLSEVQLYS